MRCFYTLLILVFGFTSQEMTAQRQAFWQYIDGQTDSGRVKGLSTRLKDENELVLFPHYNDRKNDNSYFLAQPAPLQFLLENGDTLLTRRMIEGESQLLLKLYDGDLQLYRKVQDELYIDYYLGYEGQIYRLFTRVDQEKVIDILFPEADCLPYTTKAFRNNQQAQYFVNELDKGFRLANEDKRCRYYAQKESRLGLLFAVPRQKSFVGASFYSNRVNSRPYLIEMPSVGVSYERCLLPKLSWLYGQLQIRPLSHRLRSSWQYDGDPDGGPVMISGLSEDNVQESIDLFNVYAYPGLTIEFYRYQRFNFTLGFGKALVFPIHFQRTLDINTAVLALGNTPSKQALGRIQSFSHGSYTEVGLRYRLANHLWLALNFRRENLLQRWSPPENAAVIYSNLFTPNTLLARIQQSHTQIQLWYAW